MDTYKILAFKSSLALILCIAAAWVARECFHADTPYRLCCIVGVVIAVPLAVALVVLACDWWTKAR